ncbi:biotin transporter BioY [Cellulomonas shaoxiangyii]|uniref:Biotin transporter BioY n=1 Tax=Cellulomonas shaoxiangyii TaxID=2566013 RepID=A0A4P7SJZ3_9CELL|nr:biotin transporter BioY [Cellulomonas shaoxiangyii]QCB93817.1 biotin transporter BioY [Cellulomonas shaoxiangyii]TGY84489.1 biotin transporter BioY [Cellulomonas shaoxiangyii]
MSSAFDETTTAPPTPASGTPALPAPRTHRRPATDVALVATFAAFVAACTLVPSIPTGAGVPITLQTFGVMLAGLVLGPLRGFLAVALYLVVGLAGVPVFADLSSGLGTLGKPSVGYLLAFPLAALVAGLLSRVALRAPVRRRWAALAAAGLGASFLTVHPAGVAGLMWLREVDLPAALAIDVVYWPGDVLKNLLAGAVTVAVLRAFPDLRPDVRPRQAAQPS